MDSMSLRSAVPFMISTLFPTCEIEQRGNHLLITSPEDDYSTGQLVAFATRMNFGLDESPQVTLSEAAVTKVHDSAANMGGGLTVEPAYGYLVYEDADHSLTLVIVPASVHKEHAVTGGTFAIGQTRRGRVYRRDRFEQAAAIDGVLAARMQVGIA